MPTSYGHSAIKTSHSRDDTPPHSIPLAPHPTRRPEKRRRIIKGFAYTVDLPSSSRLQLNGHTPSQMRSPMHGSQISVTATLKWLCSCSRSFYPHRSFETLILSAKTPISFLLASQRTYGVPEAPPAVAAGGSRGSCCTDLPAS